jgi:hypothetical protein
MSNNCCIFEKYLLEIQLLKFLCQGRVVVGVGRFLRIYDLGKKKLLRKCENKVNVHTCVHNLLNPMP